MIIDDDMSPTGTAFPSFLECCPTDTSTILPCNILGGQLWVGSFVVLTGQRIVRYVDNYENDNKTKLIGNIFVLYDGANNLPCSHFYKGLKGRELVQTLYSTTFTLDEISDLAFIFSKETIETKGILLHGITNAFVCRYYKDHNTNIILPASLISFPCQFPNYSLWAPYFPKRVWDSIQATQKAFRQLLSVKSNKQGYFVPNRKKNILFPFEVWNYIIMRLSTVDVLPQDATRSTILHKLLSGFARTSVREKQASQSISITTPQQLVALQRIFGTFILFGSRYTRPKLGTTSHLQENSAINVIAGESLTPTTLPGNFYNTTKIQLTMCNRNELIVSVTYGLYLYKTLPSTGEPLNCPSRSLRSVIMNFPEQVGHSNTTHPTVSAHVGQAEQQHVPTAASPAAVTASLSVICPGRRFRLDGHSYKVTSIADDDHVVCHRDGISTFDGKPLRISMIFPPQIVAQQIMIRTGTMGHRALRNDIGVT